MCFMTWVTGMNTAQISSMNVYVAHAGKIMKSNPLSPELKAITYWFSHVFSYVYLLSIYQIEGPELGPYRIPDA